MVAEWSEVRNLKLPSESSTFDVTLMAVNKCTASFFTGYILSISKSLELLIDL